MEFIKIKNAKGTADKTPPTGHKNWLDFWERKRGKKTTRCEVLLCNGSPDLGGHVIKAGAGGKEYILPMCYSCNNKDDVFEAWDSDLVSVE